jgi:hypothetical protein
MTTDPSERSKMVSVLCSILHLQSEETRTIAEKWMVKQSSGLVGWLLPSQPQAATVTTVGKGKVGHNPNNVGDVTYDPVTGSGMDFSSTY